MELEKYEADCHWKISWSRLHSFFGKFIRFPFISRVLLSLSPLLQTINWNYQLKLSTETPRCTEESRSADNERLITQEHIHSLPITRSNMLIVLLITDPGQLFWKYYPRKILYWSIQSSILFSHQAELSLTRRQKSNPLVSYSLIIRFCWEGSQRSSEESRHPPPGW